MKAKSSNIKIIIIAFLLGMCLGIGLVLVVQYFSDDTEYVLLTQKEKIPSPIFNENIIQDSSTHKKEVPREEPQINNSDLGKEKEAIVHDDTTIDQPEKSDILVLNNSDDEIGQDELLAIRTIYIPSATNNRQRELDSLLIEDKTPQKKNSLRVEFWRSPINYAGYRMSPDKLVLFGFYQPSEVLFEVKENRIQIKYKNNEFLLENTDDFKSLYIKRELNKK